MRNLAVLVIHYIATLARLLGPGGVRSLVAESLLLKECNIRSRSPCLVFFHAFWLSTSYLSGQEYRQRFRFCFRSHQFEKTLYFFHRHILLCEIHTQSWGWKQYDFCCLYHRRTTICILVTLEV